MLRVSRATEFIRIAGYERASVRRAPQLITMELRCKNGTFGIFLQSYCTHCENREPDNVRTSLSIHHPILAIKLGGLIANDLTSNMILDLARSPSYSVTSDMLLKHGY